MKKHQHIQIYTISIANEFKQYAEATQFRLDRNEIGKYGFVFLDNFFFHSFPSLFSFNYKFFFFFCKLVNGAQNTRPRMCIVLN